MSGNTITVTPSSAADAYARVQNGALGGTDAADASPGSGEGFGGALARAIQGVADAGHRADVQSARAITGQGNLTDLATSVTKAELALQTAISIRDRVVQAYQDVSRMAI